MDNFFDLFEEIDLKDIDKILIMKKIRFLKFIEN